MRLPGDFIGIAEDSGIIVDIGEWTMRTVARTLAAWHRQHINTRIGLNISPRQLERADFFRMLEQAMETAGGPWDLPSTEERRLGEEGVSTVRTWWLPYS